MKLKHFLRHSIHKVLKKTILRPWSPYYLISRRLRTLHTSGKLVDLKCAYVQLNPEGVAACQELISALTEFAFIDYGTLTENILRYVHDCREQSPDVDRTGLPKYGSRKNETIAIPVSEGETILDLIGGGLLRNVAKGYLNGEYRISSVSINTVYPNPTEEKFGSQVYHTDDEDSPMLVFLIYLNSVNLSNGPFRYIPRSIYSPSPTLQFIQGFRFPKKALREQVFVTGRRGSLMIFDPSRLVHAGPFVEFGSRVSLSIRVTSLNPLHKS